MVTRFSINTQDIIKVMHDITGKYPESTLSGVYSYDDLDYVIRTSYKITRYMYHKILVRFIKENVIYKQKILRRDMSTFTVLWVDKHKLYELYDVFITEKSQDSIRTRLMSYSLLQDIVKIADTTDNSKLRTAINVLSRKDFSDKHDRHFTINNEGVMKYTPKGRKTALNADADRWISDDKYRCTIKYGKALRKILQQQSITFDDQTIESLVNKLRSAYVFNGKIDIVEGEEIRKWYHYRNYSGSNTDTLGNSCMRHQSCQDYFDIYTKNKDKVRMIIATDDDNKLIGRAILWNTDNIGLFCDRIYGNLVTIEAIKKYAKSIGAYVKKHQSYNDSSVVSTIGEIFDAEIQVTLKGGFEQYPYMDTMKYTDDVDSEIITLSSTDGCICLDSTDGGPDQNYVTLHNGDRCHEDDARYIERYEEYYHHDDTVYSEYHGEDIVYDESITIQGGDDYAWQDSEDFRYVESENEYYHIDDIQYSDYEGEWYYNWVECAIHGVISVDSYKTIEIGDKEFTVHDDVDVNDLLENHLITQEEYEEYELEQNVE